MPVFIQVKWSTTARQLQPLTRSEKDAAAHKEASAQDNSMVNNDNNRWDSDVGRIVDSYRLRFDGEHNSARCECSMES